MKCEINEFANPQTCYAGLIHEGVNVSVENRFVGAIEVQIGGDANQLQDDQRRSFCWRL